MAAAFAALAEDALPPFKLAGFALGEKVDAATWNARGLSAPEKVVVSKEADSIFVEKLRFVPIK